MRRRGAQGAEPAWMVGRSRPDASAPGFQQVQRLGPAHLADGNAVGAQAQRGADEIGERGDPVLGAQRDEGWGLYIAARACPR